MILRFIIVALLWTYAEPNVTEAFDPPVVKVFDGFNSKAFNDEYDLEVQKHAVPTPQATFTHQEPVVIDKSPSSRKSDVSHDDVPEGSCAFTFTMPDPIATNHSVCVTNVQLRSRTINHMSTMRNLREEVRDWQKPMERKLSKHTSGLNRIKNDVAFIKNESRNMNERIARLHLLLLNEMIRQRDETIDVTRLENTILNATLKYHKLKDQHDIVVSDNKRLQQKTEAQQEQIDYLQKRVTEMTSQVNTALLKAEEAAAWCKQTSMIVNSPTPRNQSQKNEKPHVPPPVAFRDCSEVQRRGINESGIHSISIPGLHRDIEVWCDQEQDPGGWIVIQRRVNGEVNFYRNLQQYKRGFGHLDSEFWLGLNNIHHITSQPDINYKLHIDLEDWNGVKTFVEYDSFRVESEKNGFKLKIAHFSGSSENGDSLIWHNNMNFSTRNVDNDLYSGNCAMFHRGGWWYNSCAKSNLNGKYYQGGRYRSSYQNGIYWDKWRGKSYSLKRVEMKIRPTE